MQTENRLRKLLAAGLVLATLLAGCAGGSNAGSGDTSAVTIKPLGEDEEAVVKTMYWDDQSFMMQYGNLFLSKFPNVDLQIANMQSMYASGQVVDPKKALKAFIEKEQPDVLMLTAEQYAQMVEEGGIMELETMIKKDGFDTEGMHPAVIELLKEQGGGQLYGLAPTFSSSALFYNADLFKKHGIEPPSDRMSWQDVMQLAARFPTGGSEEERIYGFSTDAPQKYYLIMQMGYGLGLNMIDTAAKKITINTPSWRSVFETVIAGLKSDAVYMPGDGAQNFTTFEDYLKRDLFVVGRSAMTMNGAWLIQNMDNAEEQIKDYKPVNWGIVTVPVDPANPDYSTSFSVSTIYAIRADSPNKSAAWELVKYLNSDEFAKIQSRTLSGDLLTRTSHKAEINGRSLEPFYSLKPRPPVRTEGTVPGSYYEPFMAIVDEELEAVLSDKKSLDEALAAIETRGQEELDKAIVQAEQEEQEKQAEQEQQQEDEEKTAGNGQ